MIDDDDDDDDDNECGAVGGMRVGKRNRVLGENLPQCHFSTTNPT
jgi:hypothetical protein